MKSKPKNACRILSPAGAQLFSWVLRSGLLTGPGRDHCTVLKLIVTVTSQFGMMKYASPTGKA